MKKYGIALLSLLQFGLSKAQVGIGTTTPDASARLHVNSSNKGFLPPRINLTSTADISTITSPAIGLLVYNLATAGAAPRNVSPGFYFYDGSKWQRMINQQPDATVEFDRLTPTTSGVSFSGAAQSKDYIYVSMVDASQWIYNGSTYVTYSAPASTAWSLSGGTNDAGSNKTGGIYRSGKVGIGNTAPNANLDIRSTPTSTTDPGAGFIGIGTTSSTAAAAGAGALRYNPTSGQMEYSNGTSWSALVVGNAPRYAQYRGNAAQTFNAFGGQIEFPVTIVSVGGFSISNNKVITLPAGRVYRVDLNLGWANLNYARFAVYNAATNQAVSPTAHFEGAANGSFAGSGTVSTFINTGSGSITIDVRYVAVAGWNTILGDPGNGGNFPTLTIQAVD